MMSNGMMTARPMTRWTCAVPLMPRYCTANAASMRATPIKNAVFSEKETAPNDPAANVHVRMAAFGSGTRALRM